MDLFSIAGVDYSEIKKPVKETKAPKEVKVQDKKASKEVKAKKETKVAKTEVSFPQDEQLYSLADDWEVVFAGFKYPILDIAKRLLDLEGEHELDFIKQQLALRLPSNVVQRMEERRAAILAFEEEKANEAQVNEEEVATEYNEEEQEWEEDEETGEMVKKSKSGNSSTLKIPKSAPQPYEGDLTLEMIRQGLAYDLPEFSTKGAVSWKIMDKEKKIFPYISSGKLGNGFRKIYDSIEDWQNTEPSKRRFISYIKNELTECEIRENEFLQVRNHIAGTMQIEAGYYNKMPLIPKEMLYTIYNLFRFMATRSLEVAVYITCHRETKAFKLYCPIQTVSPVEAKVTYPYHVDEEIVVYMHSHHNMDAYFSKVDDQHDRALAIYGVMGRVNSAEPQFKFRVSGNKLGYFYDIELTEVFKFGDYLSGDFPREWLENIQTYEGESLCLV